MSEMGTKIADQHHRLQVKPSSSAAATATGPVINKHQGIVKKEREPASPSKHSLPKTSLQSASSSKIASSTSRATSSKVTQKSSAKRVTVKQEKKVYTLPGQKHDPPDEREPLRIFYGSLYEQNPKSEMAQIWMMEHGLLSSEAAKKVLERKKKNQLNQKLGIPSRTTVTKTVVKSEKAAAAANIMAVTPARKSFTSNGDAKAPAVKRKLDLGSDSDDDRVLKPKKKLSTSA